LTTNVSAAADQAKAVAIQADGKILIAGTAAADTQVSSFAVIRLDITGDLDTIFGNGGVLTVDVSVSSDQANAVAIEAGGKIIVAGTADADLNTGQFAAVRILAEDSDDDGLPSVPAGGGGGGCFIKTSAAD
jgi:uncharacterized delta-60 repeat protein